MTRYRATVVWTLISSLVAALLPSCGSTGPPETGSAQTSIIYGADERYDHYELTDPVILMVASADVALFDTSQVTPNAGGYDLDLYSYGTFGQYYDLCPSEPYESQPAPAFCSGFKVGDDLIVTAGHCIDAGSCASTAFVFGFVMQDAATPVGWVGADNVYFCTNIVGRAFTATDDWAVVQVDRSIVGYPSLPVRRTSAVESDPDVFGIFVVGHPGGIPLKHVGGSGPAGVTGQRGASVRNTAVDYFESDLDVYAGNSGSAVYSLNQQGELLYVEGILARGNPDWAWTGSCYVSNVCSETTGCGGWWEDVTRATNFEDFIPTVCGDSLCEDGGEDCLSCPADCGFNTAGPTLLNEDFSAGLGNWTVSAGWTTGAIHSMTDYPAGGSGAPVASIASCADCNMAFSTTFDMTPYCAVRLSFWRFVDSTLDNNDYLALFFWNGSGWDTIDTWSNNSGDSNRWEYEEYALDSTYLIPDFTLGFQFRGNNANEVVQIDDVTIWTYLPAGCLVDADCDDGQFCNGVESCDPVLGCQPGTPPVVDDGVACTVDACDEVTDTVTHTPNQAACDDGLFCNGVESCDPALGCLPGTPPACDDGLFCNGVETCDPVLGCLPGTPPVVDDGVACTVDACDEVTDTITNTPDDDLCDDDNPCTSDACGAEGCTHAPTAEGDPCDDGIACTQADTCQSGVCSGEDLPCPAQDSCHQAGTCDPVTGLCTNPVSPDGTTCPEGTCRDGVCEPGDASAHSGGCGCRSGADTPLGNIILLLIVAAGLFGRRDGPKFLRNAAKRAEWRVFDRSPPPAISQTGDGAVADGAVADGAVADGAVAKCRRG